MKILGVVPAAGRGSRLGMGRPKALIPLGSGVCVLDRICGAMRAVADDTVVVISPGFLEDPDAKQVLTRNRLSTVVQEKPSGMLNAISLTESMWKTFDAVMIIWGDQVNIRQSTLIAARATYAAAIETSGGSVCVIPTAWVENPYVQYDFTHEGDLLAIKESREGDECDTHGKSDVGTFLMSTDGLNEAIRHGQKILEPSLVTGEVNFLPLLRSLPDLGWCVSESASALPIESIGVNTAEELASARAEFLNSSSSSN